MIPTIENIKQYKANNYKDNAKWLYDLVKNIKQEITSSCDHVNRLKNKIDKEREEEIISITESLKGYANELSNFIGVDEATNEDKKIETLANKMYPKGYFWGRWGLPKEFENNLLKIANDIGEKNNQIRDTQEQIQGDLLKDDDKNLLQLRNINNEIREFEENQKKFEENQKKVKRNLIISVLLEGWGLLLALALAFVCYYTVVFIAPTAAVALAFGIGTILIGATLSIIYNIFKNINAPQDINNYKQLLVCRGNEEKRVEEKQKQIKGKLEILKELLNCIDKIGSFLGNQNTKNYHTYKASSSLRVKNNSSAFIETVVENPGRGDCGYYALAIAFIPKILKELHGLFDKKPEEITQQELSLIFGTSANTNSKIIFSMLNDIRAGKCSIIKKPNTDTAKQEKAFFDSILYIAHNRSKINSDSMSSIFVANKDFKDKYLNPFVTLLRTRLTSKRIEDIQKINEVELGKESDIALDDESFINNDMLTSFYEEINKLLPKTTGGRMSEGEKNDTISNKPLKSLVEKFISKWIEINELTNDEIKNMAEIGQKKIEEEMLHAFPSCLYGGINIDSYTNKQDFNSAVDAWWSKDNKLDNNSVAMTVAKCVSENGLWATEKDLIFLAGHFGGCQLYILGKNLGRLDPGKRILYLNNSGNVHWTTRYTEDDCKEFHNSSSLRLSL